MSNQFQNENQNFASSNKWRLAIGDLVAFTRKVHDFSVPGCYSEGFDGPSPGNVMGSFTSERITYDPLVFTFLLDEDWKNWTEIFDWIVSNTEVDDPVVKDITIDLLDNRNRNLGIRVVFTEARPSALDNVMLDVDGEVPQLMSTATFKYQQMLIERK